MRFRLEFHSTFVTTQLNMRARWRSLLQKLSPYNILFTYSSIYKVQRDDGNILTPPSFFARFSY